jgi:hypothetical protein
MGGEAHTFSPSKVGGLKLSETLVPAPGCHWVRKMLTSNLLNRLTHHAIMWELKLHASDRADIGPVLNPLARTLATP